MGARQGPLNLPRVTIVMPTKDRARILPKAIEGVLSQNYEDFELVVVDDGSTDHTVSVVHSFSDGRVRYVRQPHTGRAAARNRGLKEASGALVGFLDDDDEVAPDWIATLAAQFQEDPACGMASCGTTWILPDGRHDLRLPRVVSVFPQFRARFLSGTFLVRRSVLEGSGGYAEGLPLGQNNELGWRVLKQVHLQGLHVNSVDRSLVISERRRHGLTVEEKATFARYMLAQHADVLVQWPGKRASYLRTVGLAALRGGQAVEGRRLLREARRARREANGPWPRSIKALLRRAGARASRLKPGHRH